MPISLDIPVFHDEQHGIPVVILAALRNALRVLGKRLDAARIVVMGTGVVGTAVTRLLLYAGANDVTVWGRRGVLGPHLDGLPPHTAWLARYSNPRRLRGGLADALAGVDAVVGRSAAGLLDPRLVAKMAAAPVVFALADPEPETDRRPSSRPLAVTTRTRSPTCWHCPAWFATAFHRTATAT